MNRYARWALVATLAILASGRETQCRGASYFWGVSSGTWSTPGSWSPFGPPGAADSAFILNGGTATIASGVSATCGELALGGANRGTVQLISNLASLTVGGGGELVGNTGIGTFNQTAGTNSSTSLVYLGYNTGSSGSYSLGGGYLVSPVEYAGLGGSGTFTQTGGTNSISNYLTLGYAAGVSGSYNLSGNGYVSAPILYVGVSGNGAFTQTGGAVSLSSSLYLGYNTGGSGTYNLGGGSLTSGSAGEFIGNTGNGMFNQTAGTNSTSGQVAVGYNAGNSSYVLGGGLLAAQNVVVGYSGSGTFSQTGGVVSAANQFILGYDPNFLGISGSYSLSGGSLAAGTMYDGYAGTGTIVQTGGTVSVTGDVNVGFLTFGTYSLSGGSVTTAGNLNIGTSDGFGILTQTGGSITAASVYLGYGLYSLSGSGVLIAGQETIYGSFMQSGGSNLISGSLTMDSSYSLSGGLLRLGGLTASSTFTYSGGSMQLLAGFSATGPIDLNVPGGFDTFDTGGNTATISSKLFGPGGLNKTGAGLLTLNGSDIYTGPTMVSGGTLAFMNVVPSSSFTVASGCTLVFQGMTLTLGTSSIQEMTGGSVVFKSAAINSSVLRAAASGSFVYQNATVNGGFLFGPGTHILPAGSTTTFNTTTINPGTAIQQAGSDTFFDVIDRGTMTASGSLTIIGGINDGGANMTVSGTADVSSWSNAGVITITGGGLLNNHVSDLTSYGGARIYINGGGTLNANSQGEGTALDLQDSLLVNNGRVIGTTNVYYGATVSGSGSFGPINVLQAGAVVAATSAVPAPTSLTVTSGSISGAGNLAVSATVADAILATPDLTDVLTLSGNLSGAGPITKIGPGTLVLSGSNSFGTGTNVAAGKLVVTNSYSLPDGSNLSVGSGIAIFGAPVVPPTDATEEVTPVPEPGTLVLLALGACGVAVYRGPRSRWKEE